MKCEGDKVIENVSNCFPYVGLGHQSRYLHCGSVAGSEQTPIDLGV